MAAILNRLEEREHRSGSALALLRREADRLRHDLALEPLSGEDGGFDDWAFRTISGLAPLHEDADDLLCAVRADHVDCPGPSHRGHLHGCLPGPHRLPLRADAAPGQDSGA